MRSDTATATQLPATVAQLPATAAQPPATAVEMITTITGFGDLTAHASPQVDQAELMNRSALHALMGLEATPIKAGGFKYIHRDTGLIFEIAPATPDPAGQRTQFCHLDAKTCCCVTIYSHNGSTDIWQAYIRAVTYRLRLSA